MALSKFKVNFDVFGCNGIEEWVEMDHGPKKPEKRFVSVSTEELSALEKTRNEMSTVASTNWAVKCFREFLKIKGKEVDFRTVSKEELNILLREFYGSVRNTKGEQYAINTYVGIRSGINRYINDPPNSRAWCLMKDNEFTTANNVFAGVTKTPQRDGQDKTEHHQAITDDDLQILRNSRAMDPRTPRGLLNKVKLKPFHNFIGLIA